MTADDILKIFDAIPTYIVYVYPGYLLQYFFYFFRGKTLPDSKAVLLKSIAISYFIVIILSPFVSSEKGRGWIENLIYASVAVILAKLCFEIIKRHDKKTDRNKKGSAFYENEFEALCKYDQGAWIAVYTKDDEIIYEGELGIKDLDISEQGKAYIVINNFKKYRLKNNNEKEVLEDYTESKETEAKAVIYYDTIKRIEYFKDIE